MNQISRLAGGLGLLLLGLSALTWVVQSTRLSDSEKQILEIHRESMKKAEVRLAEIVRDYEIEENLGRVLQVGLKHLEGSRKEEVSYAELREAGLIEVSPVSGENYESLVVKRSTAELVVTKESGQTVIYKK